MSWIEYVQTIEAYDVDVEAVNKYNESCALANNNAGRTEFLQRGYDPDCVNEFCYYPIEEWGTLIQWATNEYDDEGAYKVRLLRASLILAGLDPDVVDYVQNPTSSNVIHEGQILMDIYKHWSKENGVNYSFEQVRFGFNSFSGAITIMPPEQNVILQNNLESADDESNWIPMDDETSEEADDFSHLFTPSFEGITNEHEDYLERKRAEEAKEQEIQMMEMAYNEEQERLQRLEEEWQQQQVLFQQIHGDHYDDEY